MSIVEEVDEGDKDGVVQSVGEGGFVDFGSSFIAVHGGTTTTTRKTTTTSQRGLGEIKQGFFLLMLNVIVEGLAIGELLEDDVEGQRTVGLEDIVGSKIIVPSVRIVGAEDIIISIIIF